MAEFNAIFPAMRDFVNSTAVARSNGLLGGYGSPDDLKKKIRSYGLSAGAGKRLVEQLSLSRPEFRGCVL